MLLVHNVPPYTYILFQVVQVYNKYRNYHDIICVVIAVLATMKEKNIQSKQEQCLSTALFYQSKFSNNVPPMSSSEYLKMIQGNQEAQNKNILLVDCRSKNEQDVSMIDGAITLNEFYHRMKQQGYRDVDNIKTGTRDNDDDNNNNTLIVTYCTIGYRSGLEAAYMRQKFYPNLNQQIRNLDGIIAYTHALQRQDLAMATKGLIDPRTGTKTNKIHTFAKSWDYIDEPQQLQNTVPSTVDNYPSSQTSTPYETIQFRNFALLHHLLKVGLFVMYRNIQIVSLCFMRNTCKRQKRSENDVPQ